MRHQCCRGKTTSSCQSSERLGIELTHPAKAAELALDPIVEAVMIGVARDEAVSADIIIGLDALDHMHREGQPRDPCRPRRFVGEVELR